MNNNKQGLLITIYNLYTILLIPFVIILAGMWSLESGSSFTYGKGGGLPIGALIIFIPEIILGLKINVHKIFTISCSIGWLFVLRKVAYHFFIVITNASITYACIMFVFLSGVVWSIVIEFSENLRKHILLFPQEQWLVPCSVNHEYNKRYRCIWKIAILGGTIFTLVIKWGNFI